MKKTLTAAAIIISFASCQMSRPCMSSHFVGYAKTKVKYQDDIKNPANAEYINEVAFNLNIKPSQVTQEQFNKRYGIK